MFFTYMYVLGKESDSFFIQQKDHLWKAAFPYKEKAASHLSVIHLFRIHIMVHHPVLGHLFILGAGLSIIAIRINGDTAARSEFAPHFNVFRLHQFYQIIHNDIHTMLVEISMIAEAEQVQLE